MTVRVHDPALFDALRSVIGPVVLEGPGGEPFGTFTLAPAVPFWREMGITEEEFRQRLNDPRTGYTTEQVLAYLRSLTP